MYCTCTARCLSYQIYNNCTSYAGCTVCAYFSCTCLLLTTLFLSRSCHSARFQWFQCIPLRLVVVNPSKCVSHHVTQAFLWIVLIFNKVKVLWKYTYSIESLISNKCICTCIHVLPLPSLWGIILYKYWLKHFVLVIIVQNTIQCSAYIVHVHLNHFTFIGMIVFSPSVNRSRYHLLLNEVSSFEWNSYHFFNSWLTACMHIIYTCRAINNDEMQTSGVTPCIRYNVSIFANVHTCIHAICIYKYMYSIWYM